MNFSLRSRLLFVSFVLVPLMLFSAGYILTNEFSKHREKQFLENLETNLHQITSLLQENNGKITVSEKIRDSQFSELNNSIYWQVNENNASLFRSSSLAEYTLALPNDIAIDGNIHSYLISGPHNQSLKVLEQKIVLGDNRLLIAVANDHGAIEKSVSEYTIDTGVIFYVIGIYTLMIVTFQVWGGLLPLQTLQQKLIEVRSGRTSKVEGIFPQEIQPLVDELNALIINNAEVLKRSRMQTGNLAHAIKTPLAVISVLINNQVEKYTSDEQGKLRAQLTTMQRQIDYTLAQASAAMSPNIINTSCKINKRVEDIVYALSTLYQGKNIEITTHIEPDTYAKVEEQDFDEVLGNIIDNAYKWAKSKIVLSVSIDNHSLNIIVDDDGPGLQKSEREMAFKRGRRLGDTVPGSGLGLSIVRNIVESYKGKALLEDSPVGGLRVNISLPAADRSQS